MKTMWRTILSWRFSRFVMSGCCAAGVDLLLFWLLNGQAGWHRLAAQAVSRPAGGVTSFCLNKFWTFGNREMRTLGNQAMRYAVLWGGGLLGSTLLLELYRALLPDQGRHDFTAKVLAEGTLGLVSFLVQRFWVFRAGSRTAGRSVTG